MAIAMALGLAMSIGDLKARHKEIHPMTEKAMVYYSSGKDTTEC